MRTSVSVLDTHAADSALAIHDNAGPTADPSLGYRIGVLVLLLVLKLPLPWLLLASTAWWLWGRLQR
ncbi:hypothetical protein SynWH8103_01641 [Synechococcus sp. WH 8103]|nr:hypothetical protein SynWH8103_01641 [Synechococcus sp. WH 8103]